MSQIPPPPSSEPTPPKPPLGTLAYGAVPPGGFNFADFIAFRTMIALPLIMVLFWVGVLMVIVAGIITMFRGDAAGVCSGIALIVIGPFLVRIYAEFAIVIFRINETLTEILHAIRDRRI